MLTIGDETTRLGVAGAEGKLFGAPGTASGDVETPPPPLPSALGPFSSNPEPEPDRARRAIKTAAIPSTDTATTGCFFASITTFPIDAPGFISALLLTLK